MTIPEVIILSTRTTRGVRTVVIHCPFCGKRHTHGWPQGHGAPGCRVSHCVRVERATYRVVVALNVEAS